VIDVKICVLGIGVEVCFDALEDTADVDAEIVVIGVNDTVDME